MTTGVQQDGLTEAATDTQEKPDPKITTKEEFFDACNRLRDAINGKKTPVEDKDKDVDLDEPEHSVLDKLLIISEHPDHPKHKQLADVAWHLVQSFIDREIEDEAKKRAKEFIEALPDTTTEDGQMSSSVGDFLLAAVAGSMLLSGAKSSILRSIAKHAKADPEAAFGDPITSILAMTVSGVAETSIHDLGAILRQQRA